MKKYVKWIGEILIWIGQILILILKELKKQNGTETKANEEPPPPPPGHPG